MKLKCGIVGLPNVGKSTLFNALTRAGIAAENYPFCTIEPNVGIVEVPDPRLEALAQIVQPENVVPAIVEFVDIAGLVAGASQGEGLGNQFLANIRETEALLHVVRCFEDENVIHVSGRVDPLSDLEVIFTELALADLATVEKAIQRDQKKAKSGDKEANLWITLLENVYRHLNQGQPVRTLDLDAETQILLKPLCLLTIKPALFVANISENSLNGNAYLERLQHFAKSQRTAVVPICAVLEAEIAELALEDKKLFLNELGVEEPGLDRLICAAFAQLGLQTYFTAGVKEVRAWTVEIGATAPQAAAAIHTDFERGFIRAEVIRFADFIACGGEQKSKELGKMRLEGKDYIVQDGDVMHFRFNV